jgi:hypothetical protein
MNRQRVAGALVALAVFACGDIGGNEPGSAIAGAIEFRAVQRHADGSTEMLVVGSVLDSIAVEVRGPKAPRSFGHHLTRSDSVVPIAVRVDSGSNEFAVTVLSNNRIPLYTGSNTMVISAGGFRVPVPLTALREVMQATPDSLSVGPRFTGPARDSVIVVRNKGVDTLTWIAVRPPGGTYFMSDTTGLILPGGRDSLYVSSASSFLSFLVRFQSAVGEVTVKIQT